MTSDFETDCDAIIALLTGGVAALATATTHELAPWAPEELQPDGARHLAVWPVGDSAERAAAEGYEIYELRKVLRILIWEDGTIESSRQALDYPAAQAWFQLHNDVRGQFRAAARNLGGNRLVEYAGARFPERSRQVRWMEITVVALDDLPVY